MKGRSRQKGKMLSLLGAATRETHGHIMIGGSNPFYIVTSRAIRVTVDCTKCIESSLGPEGALTQDSACSFFSLLLRHQTIP